MTLRPYQEELVARVEPLLLRARRVMLQAGTGTGKTEMALALASKFLAFGGLVVWMTHRDELLGQARQRAVSMGISVQPTWENREWKSGSLNISTVGKMLRNPPPVQSLLIADEGHHLRAKTWNHVWSSHGGSRLALTATPWRLKKSEGFLDLVDDLVCAPQPADLLKQGFLEQINCFRPKTSLNTKGLKRVAGDFDMTSFEEACGDRLVDLPVQTWLKNSESGRRACLVYAPSAASARLLAGALARQGALVGLSLSGKKPEAPKGVAFEADRRAAISGFKEGYLDTLVSVDIVGEGVDIPHADMAIFARPTMSLALYLQHVGRLARLDHSFPEPSIVFDLVGNVVRHGLPYQNREWSLEPREAGSGPKVEPVRVCDSCTSILPADMPECSLCEAPRERACSCCGRLLFLGLFDGDNAECSSCLSEIPLEGLEQANLAEWKERRARKERKPRKSKADKLPTHPPPDPQTRMRI